MMSIKKAAQLFKTMLPLMLAAWVIAVAPLQVRADNDGIPDEIDGAYINVPPDGQTTYSYPTDKNKSDIFLMLGPAAGGHWLFAESLDPGVLPKLFDLMGKNEFINLHVIEPWQAEGQVILDKGAPPYAILLEENVTTTDDTAGVSDFGTPKQKLNGYVNTKRIEEEVLKVCDLQPQIDLKTSSQTYENVDAQFIIESYIKNVAVHETFHMVGCTVEDLKRIGHHYDQLDLIMDHHVYYENLKREGRIVWHISDKWGEWDRPFYY